MNEEKIMILQMLQDGKITSEEAIKLLEALDEPDFEIPEYEAADDSGHKTRLTNKTLEEIGSDIGNAFSNLFTGLKDIGSSIGINNLTETIEMDLEENIQNLTDPIIDLKSVNGYIKLRKHELDTIKINIHCQYKEGTLTPHQEFYKFHIENNNIVFHPIYNNDIAINLDVSIPYQVYDEITLETTNGSIIVNGLDINKLRCETKNNSITLSDIKSEKINLSTMNGRIEGTFLNSTDIEAITTNSGVFLDHVVTKNFNAHTANGKIKLNDMNSDKIIAKTSNSTIDTDRLSARYIDLKTSNGKIIYDFFDMEKTKEIILSTSNGTIISTLSEMSKHIYFDLETSMGSIHLEHPNLIYKINRQANFGLKKVVAHTSEYDNNEDFIKFSAYTSNGSIKIN